MTQFTAAAASTIGSSAFALYLHRIHKRGGEPSNLFGPGRADEWRQHVNQMGFVSICSVAREIIIVQRAPLQNRNIGRAHIQETR